MTRDCSDDRTRARLIQAAVAITDDSGANPILGGFRSRVFGIGPQFGYLFPVGDMQGYINVKAYCEFAAENRPAGWNAWLTFSISPMAPASTVAPKRRVVTKWQMRSKRGTSS
jgi:hypothetical protein